MLDDFESRGGKTLSLMSMASFVAQQLRDTVAHGTVQL